MEFKIIYNKKECIGAGVCEAFSKKHWRVKGKAELVGSVHVGDNIFEKIIQENELAENKLAAEGCPRNCIKIFSKSGEEVKLNR